MDTKQENKQEIQKQDNQTNNLVAFAENIILAKLNRITKAKDTSINSISFEFSAVDLGYSVAVVDKVKISINRETINKIVCSLLGCAVEQYKKVVIAKIEQEQAYTEYNQEIRKILKEQKHLVLKLLNK